MESARPRAVTAVVFGASPGSPPDGLDRVPDGVELRFATSAPELRSALPGAEVLFVLDYAFRALADAWESASSLRWIHVAAAGVDALLIPEIRASDAVVTNSRGVFDEAMGEYALGLLLAFSTDLATTVRLQTARTWSHRETERLAGARVLVLGAGGVARATARLLRAVGCTVRVVGRTTRSDAELGEVAGVDELAALLPDADFVVVTVPLTPGTRGLIGKAELARMRPTARLVNLARGAVVDQDALVDALRDGRIGGAALDVFVAEPLPPDHPLWALPNVIVSPHMSGDFVGHQRALVELFLTQLDRYRRGAPLANLVDKRLGFVAGP